MSRRMRPIEALLLLGYLICLLASTVGLYFYS